MEERVLKSKHTDQELKDIAKDIYRNNIFTDWHIENPEDIKLSFMILRFMEKEDFEDVGLVYEYMSKAGPRSVNGLPTFMSCRLLNIKEVVVVREYYHAYKEAMETV